MIHFSCDSCGCVLDEERFSVTIDVRAAHDPNQLTTADLDADHLSQLAAELEEQLATGQSVAPPEQQRRQSLQFDLCPACRNRFLDDPLGRDALGRLNFSQN